MLYESLENTESATFSKELLKDKVISGGIWMHALLFSKRGLGPCVFPLCAISIISFEVDLLRPLLCGVIYLLRKSARNHIYLSVYLQ